MFKSRVYYQDTDAGGVVYFANYLRFFEKSWFEYLLSIGLFIPEWEEKDTFIIVRSASLDLLEKLKYGDLIEVTTAVTEIKNAYFILAHEVAKEGRVVTRGHTKMVCIDGRGKPKRMPEEFRAKLTQHHNSEVVAQ